VHALPTAAAAVAALLLAATGPGAEAHPGRVLSGAGHAEAASAMAMARAARASGDRAAARDWLGLAIDADPEWELPRVELAEVLLAADADPRATATANGLLEEAAGTLRGNPRLFRLLGLARARLGDGGGAAEAWARSLELADDPDLRLLRGTILRDLAGRGGEAIAELERVRNARPLDPAPRSQLADAYEAAGRRADAEAELRWLAAAAPASPVALRRLARFYQRGNDLRRSEEAEQSARALEQPNRRLRPLRARP